MIGLGAVAGASALGTGAFSAGRLRNRTVSVAVVNDTNGLVGLVPNPDVNGVHDNGGELTIDLDDPGINQNSVYQFGFFVDDEQAEEVGDIDGFPIKEQKPSIKNESDGFGSAFLIANQTGREYNLTISYDLAEANNGESGEFNTEFWFEAHKDGERVKLIHGPTSGNQPTNKNVTLGSGEVIGVSFLLNVPDDTLGEEIDGSLSIDAVVPS